MANPRNITENNTQKRGEIHLAFAMYIFGFIIPHSSVLLTIPTAFIRRKTSLDTSEGDNYNKLRMYLTFTV